ncbi:glycoside hydrolase family 105 protein [Uliginosibacterium sp. sgz301328]|uniref:glycoside hydrolase family 88/105 protein n=1 Tax=Uliginosibacterium sp. sgz301328 TaxID=3243764 RepID=UPI00359E1653
MTHPSWSIRMADTALHRWRKLPAEWSHEHGVLFKSLLHVWRMTGETRYLDFVRGHMNAVVDPDGHIAGYDLRRYSLNDLMCGRVLYRLFQHARDARYLKAASVLRTQYLRQPRTLSGSFWHKREFPDQVFLDSAYMAVPFYVDCARSERNKPALFDAGNQLLEMAAKHQDPVTGLYFHGWDETRRQPWADPESGCSASFWSRATGWFAMALVDTLDLLPSTHEQRPALTNTLRRLVRALLAVQDADSGLWWQVLDQGGRPGNYLESSGSAMFIYAMARGVRHGYVVDSDVRARAERAFAGLLDHDVESDANGWLTLHNTCKSAGLGLTPERDGSFDYYVSEPRVDNDPKGVAAFILAATEIERLQATS